MDNDINSRKYMTPQEIAIKEIKSRTNKSEGAYKIIDAAEYMNEQGDFRDIDKGLELIPKVGDAYKTLKGGYKIGYGLFNLQEKYPLRLFDYDKYIQGIINKYRKRRNRGKKDVRFF